MTLRRMARRRAGYALHTTATAREPLALGPPWRHTLHRHLRRLPVFASLSMAGSDGRVEVRLGPLLEFGVHHRAEHPIIGQQA